MNRALKLATHYLCPSFQGSSGDETVVVAADVGVSLASEDLAIAVAAASSCAG